MPQSSRLITTGNLIIAAAEIVRSVHSDIRISIQEDPEEAFEKITLHPLSGGEKDILAVDKSAEHTAKKELEKLFPGDIKVIGEESLLRTEDLSTETKLCALLDMVDGTDLLERGVPLWCSAMIFFDPQDRKGPKIRGAMIGLPNGEIYYSSDETPNEGFVYRDPTSLRIVEKMRGPAERISLEVETVSLENASICFYGQKAKNFLSFNRRRDFQFKLKALSKKDPFRIYNFAGNPIMVKLADRLKKEVKKQVKDKRDIVIEVPISRGFDAVVDLLGQHAHDAIPGLYIATHAGAFLCHLDGKKMTESELAIKLLRPTGKIQYILASTEALAQEIASLIKNVVPETDELG